MADKKDLTFEELTESLKKNNMEMSDSVKKQIEAQLETNKVLKEDSIKADKAVKDVHGESLKVLKDIKNILTSMTKVLTAASVKDVAKSSTNKPVNDERIVVQDGVPVSETGSAELVVIAKNTSSLLMMSRDINVMRQNVQQLVKIMGGEKKIGADKDFRKESVLREKTDVDIQRAKAAPAAIAPVVGGGGGAQPPASPDKGEADKAGGFFGKLKGVAGSMSGWAKNLLALSAALFITAKAFQEFSKVKWDGVIKGTVAMFALAKAAKMAGEGDNYKNILALGAGTLALAFAMNKFADVTWESIFKGALAMFALGKAAKVAGSGDAYKSILAIGAGTIALAYGLQKFADVSWTDVLFGATTMLVLGKAAKIAGSGDAYKSILAIGVGTLALAYGLDKFADVTWGGVIKGTVAMIALAKAAEMAGDGDAHKTILALGVGTLALAFAMDKFADVSWGGVIKGTIALIGLGAAAKMVGDDGWKTILALGGAMFILSKAFENFAEISWGDFAKGVVAMIALVAAVNLASGSLVGGVAMVLLAGAVYVISEAFKNFAEISWGDVLKGVAVIALLAIGAAALAVLAVPIIITAGALTLLGASMLVLGAGVTSIGESLTSVTSGIKELAELDGANLLLVAAGIGAIALALLAFGAAQMGAALENLIANFLSFGQDSPIDQIKELSEIDGSKLRDTGDGLQSIADALSMMSNLDADNLEDIMDAMNDFPWLRATLYAKAGGVFNVKTSKATMTGGDGSKIQFAGPAGSTGGASPAPGGKAPITSENMQKDPKYQKILKEEMQFADRKDPTSVRAAEDAARQRYSESTQAAPAAAPATDSSKAAPASRTSETVTTKTTELTSSWNDGKPTINGKPVSREDYVRFKNAKSTKDQIRIANEATGAEKVTPMPAAAPVAAAPAAPAMTGTTAGKTVAPAGTTTRADKVVPVSKAPVVTEALFIANEPVTKDRPLSKIQRAVMKQQISSGNSSYPDWVMQKYKTEGDELAAKSSETAAAQRAPVGEGGGDRTLINAPTTVTQSTQNNITKLPVRNSDPAYVDYIRKRFSI